MTAHSEILRSLGPQVNRGAALPDHVGPDTRILFVGINPGMRSASLGHHFAGASNRFWKLLRDAALVPPDVGFERDKELPSWGLGITNLVGRATPGVADLEPQELVAGARRLRGKIRRWQPASVALVGATVYRALFSVRAGRIEPGMKSETIHGARVHVLPNPSGRNAHYSYARMLACFVALREREG